MAAPTVISQRSDVPGFSDNGVNRTKLVVAGFTTDAALNGTWDHDPAAPDASNEFTQPGSSGDNYLGHQSGPGKWILYGEFGVTTSEDKAEVTRAFSPDPRGEYTGLGDSSGDTVTVTWLPPRVITDP